MDTNTPEKSATCPDLQDEDKLVDNARHDTEAFASLYKRYLAPIYRYLLTRLNTDHDAEDLTAQVFTEALEGIVADRYRSGGNFAAWLFTIARRRLVDFYRKHPTAELTDPPSQEPSPLSIVEHNENIQRLAHLLTQLDEEHRELLRLRFSAGLNFSQISILEGRSEPAVKMALYRTIAFLQEHWEADNG